MSKKQKLVTVGLKQNALFLLEEMSGVVKEYDKTVPHFAATFPLTMSELERLKELIVFHGGEVDKCLRKIDNGAILGAVDYQCYFTTTPIRRK